MIFDKNSGMFQNEKFLNGQAFRTFCNSPRL